ncbi:glycosyltransferase family 2 protein [Agarivorans gilvus]|uniref:Fucosyltransferase n=1 Tax=Agarivorans gilvus TaxID=680279 RepID=A0ABQ1HYC9_9ALTE|nr:glycosyltransferase family A protein [Agarivorans gilvus]GGA98963.1 fucosyltransferase [Agarivorans gilvus]
MISVVIPLYNKSNYISRAINSVLNQTMAVHEIIVIDDGSTDNSAEIVSASFPMVKLISQSNSGVSAARNTGILHSKGEYIAFLDADDYWTEHFINNINFLIKRYPNAQAFCTNYAFKEKECIYPAKLKCSNEITSILDDYFDLCCNADLPITASSVCINKSLLEEEIGGFPQGVAMGEDQIVWAELACRTKIAFHSHISVYYDRDVQDSACKTNHIYSPAPQVYVYKKLLAENKVPRELVNSLIHLIHLTVLSCVKNNLLVGNRKKALTILLSKGYLKFDKYRLMGFLLLFFPRFFVAKIFSVSRNDK